MEDTLYYFEIKYTYWKKDMSNQAVLSAYTKQKTPWNMLLLSNFCEKPATLCSKLLQEWLQIKTAIKFIYCNIIPVVWYNFS